MKISRPALIVSVSLGVALVAFNAVYFAVTGFAAESDKESREDSSVMHNGKSDAEKPGSGKAKDAGYGHNYPVTAYEYAKMSASRCWRPARSRLVPRAAPSRARACRRRPAPG